MTLVASIITGLIVIILFTNKSCLSGTIIPIVAIIGIYAIVMTLGFYQTPESYKLSKRILFINKKRRPIEINLKDIVIIRKFERADRIGMIRLWGSEGAFGNYGYYSSKKHKKLNVYTSRDSNWVFIQINSGKKYIISPDDLKIVDKINELILQSKPQA